MGNSFLRISNQIGHEPYCIAIEDAAIKKHYGCTTCALITLEKMTGCWYDTD